MSARRSLAQEPLPADVPTPRGEPVPPRLSLHNVSHSFGRVAAVDHATLDIAPGAIVSLLGPSGCGKTTLLRIAAGIERQTSGTVMIDGDVVGGRDLFIPAEARFLGLVFQDFALFPHLTVMQNVIYGMRGLGKPEARRQARAALARLGIDAHEAAYPHMLSGGEQQRVALVRALLPAPRVMLLDEPFSGLDRGLRGAVRDETVAVLRERGATAVIVTHDPAEALEISDFVALMREGRIVQVGTPEEVYRQPVDLDAARFFSEVNLFEATVATGAAATPLGAIAAPGLRDGTAILVALRPQSLYIASDGTGVAARVERVGFGGDAYLLKLAVSGLDTHINMRVARKVRPQPGETVNVRIEGSEALIFSAV